MLRSVTVLGAWLSVVTAARWGDNLPPAPVPEPRTLINAIRTCGRVYYQGNTNCDAVINPEGPGCDKSNPGYEALVATKLFAIAVRGALSGQQT